MHSVFISYADEDLARAEAVRDGLESRGLRCWIASRDIPAGSIWGKVIYDAIRKSKIFVLVFSGQTNTSVHVLREIDQADRAGINIVPYLVENVEPAEAFGYYLGTLQCLNAYRFDPEKAFEILWEGICFQAPSLRDLALKVSQAEAPGGEPRPDARSSSSPSTEHQQLGKDVLRPRERNQAPSKPEETSGALVRQPLIEPERGPGRVASLMGLDERAWDALLDFLEEGQVVPVLGPDLLTITVDGRQTLLYPYLAERVAEHLEISSEDLPAMGALNELAYRWLAQGGDLEDLYAALKLVFPSRDQVTLPKPLLQLAGITAFRLFVTTTFDPFLQQALDEVRFGGEPRTRVVTHSPWNQEDLREPIEGAPVVFHLFGRLSVIPEYAVTEEDTLEFIHSLSERRPDHLFDELSRRKILWLDGHLPDWPARFLLRAFIRQRLWASRSIVFIPGFNRDFVSFLRRFSLRARVFQVDGTAAFVEELYQRWIDRHPPGRTEKAFESAEVMRPGAVFLSYTNEDREIVEALGRALDKFGVDAFFNRDDLRSGDAFEAIGRRNIARCSMFIPIISRHTLTSEPRFFRLEWNYALREALRRRPNERFIIPVVIDDTPQDHPALPEEFRRLHWEHLEPEHLGSDFAQKIRNLFREYQRGIHEL